MGQHEREKVFLTGGSGGLGFEIGNKFAKEGWDVIAPTHKELDLSDPGKVQEYVDRQMQKVGPIIKAFVHSAGINPGVAKLSATNSEEERANFDISEAMAEFNNVLQVNSTSFLHLGRSMLQAKQEAGTLDGYTMVALSSLFGGNITRPGKMPYSTSKAMLEQMVRQLAVEWRPHGVRVNGIEPGFFPTQMTIDNLVKRYGKDIIPTIEAQTPLGRMGKPSEIASVAYFLCSEESSFVSGIVIPVDGGFLAGGGMGVWDIPASLKHRNNSL